MPKLTKTYVTALEPQERDYFAWDSEVPSFGVRVFASGRKSFLVQYRSGGRTRRMTLGKFGVLTVEDARKEAKAVLGGVVRGDNPAETRRQERTTPTMKAVCERFWREHVQARGKPATRREYRRLLDQIIIPRLGNHRITDLSRRDIAKLHHELRERPYQANRTLAVLSKLFNLCEVWGLRPDGSNPCRHVPKYKEEKRERYLTGEELQRLGAVLRTIEEEDGPNYRERDKELGATWPELTSRNDPDAEEAVTLRDGVPDPYPVPYVSCVRLLLLTGCRLSEIQTLRWEHVKGDILELPDSKSGAKRIYLGRPAVEELARIPRLPGNPYVITGNVEGGPFNDMQKPWRRIRKRAGLEDVRLHDLRHSFASGAVGLGETLPMIGKLLGHSQVQTTARYAHLADDPVRTSAERISAELAKTLNSR